VTEKAGDHTNSVNGAVSEEKINGLQTRPDVGPCGLLTAGSVSTVLIDYRAVREDEVSVTKGEVVTVIASNLTRGYLVHRAALSHVSPPAEGWIPSYCLHIGGHHTKKPSAWAFKIRKQSFSKLSKQESSASLGDRGFVEHLNNMSVTLGEKAVFSCRLETSATIGCQLVWKGPGGGILQSGGRVMAETSDNGGLTPATLNRLILQYSLDNKHGHTQKQVDTAGENFHVDHHLVHTKNYGIYNSLMDMYFNTATFNDKYKIKPGLYCPGAENLILEVEKTTSEDDVIFSFTPIIIKN